MDRRPYRLQMWTQFENENRFIPLFLDMNTVTGFFIPEREEENQDRETINLLFGTEVITVKQEPHIIDFLRSTFINVAKTKGV